MFSWLDSLTGLYGYYLVGPQPPFGANITRADSPLEMAPPPLFPDPVSQSG
jgi:hypothetical protein